jgi:hypothetical protein
MKKTRSRKSRDTVPLSVNLRQFAERAQITFGAIAKGNLLPFAMCFKKQADFLL